jgi:hypothetical protein
MPNEDVAPVIQNEKIVLGLKRLVATFTGGLRVGAKLGHEPVAAAAVGRRAGGGRCVTSGRPARGTHAPAHACGRAGACTATHVGTQVWANCVRMRHTRTVYPLRPAEPSWATDDDDDDDDRPACAPAAVSALAPPQGSWPGFVVHLLFVYAAGAGAVLALLPSRVSALCAAAPPSRRGTPAR